MTVHTLTLEWQGITIDIEHDDEWCNYPHLNCYVHHIKLRRRDEGQLPMSNTGFYSNFFTGRDKESAIAPYSSALDLVKAWLNETGQSKQWRAYIESQKQLTLF